MDLNWPRSRGGVILVGASVAFAALFAFSKEAIPPDAWTYLAAGERLNSGGDLYRLQPGDREVPMVPPYWSVPLLSPPFIAVVWRPIALAGEPGAFAWAIVGMLGAAMTIGLLVRRAPLATTLVVLPLTPVVAEAFLFANVNLYLASGLVLLWWLWRQGHYSWAAFLVVALSLVKVVPALFVLFLLLESPWRPVARGIAIGLASLGAISLIGAGLGAHLEYLAVVLETPPSIGSVATYLANRGVNAPWIGYGLALFGAAHMWLFRRHPDWVFVTATITVIVASPVINTNTWILLIAILAPVAWSPEARPPSGRVAHAGASKIQPSSSS